MWEYLAAAFSGDFDSDFLLCGHTNGNGLKAAVASLETGVYFEFCLVLILKQLP